MAIFVGKIYRTLRITVLATDLDSLAWIQFHNCSSVFSNQMFLVTLRRKLNQWNRYCVGKGCTRVQTPQSRSWVVWNSWCTRLCYNTLYKTIYSIFNRRHIVKNLQKPNLKSTKCQIYLQNQISNLLNAKLKFTKCKSLQKINLKFTKYQITQNVKLSNPKYHKSQLHFNNYI
jgi:hypothetical protein